MESITKEIAQQLLEVAAADRSALLAENAQLKASNEQLRAELTNWRVTAARGHDDQCNLGALCPYCQIDKLKAQVEQLKADGERPLRDTGILKSAMESVLVSEEWSKELR